MENNVELIKQNLKLFSQDGNKFNKETGFIFAKAVTKMSLAKNIKLAEGTIRVWEECLIEDINRGTMDFEDFIIATGKVIRDKLYNRIDYADIYEEATTICKDRRSKILPKIDKGIRMPEELKEIIVSFGNNIKE